jgi:hypothetical protein
MDLFERLSRERKNIAVHASDFFDALYIVTSPGTSWKVVFNRALAPVQYVGRRLVIPANRKPKHFWPTLLRQPKAQIIGLVLRPWLRATELPTAFETLTRALHGPSGGVATEARRSVKRISLFDPRCRALAEVDSRFTLGQSDFFTPSHLPYHAIRIMNALSAQVPDAEMKMLLTAIHSSLREDGLFVEGNGADECVQATVFRRSNSGFVAISTLNNGSRLQSKVENFRTTKVGENGGSSSA